ncbi:MAG: Gfo/Idh/MocA family oxidoreductase [Anaerolineales bacterium]
MRNPFAFWPKGNSWGYDRWRDGPGRIAEKFADDLQAVPGAEIYAIASRSGGHAFASKFDVPVIYDHYQDLAEDPSVDAIYVATPHPFHFENAQLCLEAGKPVLIEKPITVTAQQAESLIELARSKKVFLMEAFWTRFLPVYQTIRTWLDSGTLERVVTLHASFCFTGKEDEQDRWLNPELAGGTLLDVGIYPISVFQWILQENPIHVQALAALGKTGVDTTLSVQMQYPGGAMAQFFTSFEIKSRGQMSIYGTRGAIHINDDFHGATMATLVANGKETSINEGFRAGGFEYQIEEAMDCIRQGLVESPRMSHADSLANIQLMDAIRAQIGLKYPFE